MTAHHSIVFVRDATVADQELITQHRQLSKEEAKKYRGSTQDGPAVSHVHSFVGGFGDTVFGSITVGGVQPQRWHVVHVYVEPHAREVGVGDAMVRHALQYLRTQDALWLSAQALPGDRAMKNLFERHGLVAQVITVGKSLNDPSTEVGASQ